MKLALYQMTAAAHPAPRDQRIKEALTRASAAGADLMVAPELALSGYGAGAALRDLAQPAEGDWSLSLQEVVEETGCALVTGFPERLGENLHISAMALRPGQPPVIYRKGFLYGAYEKEIFTPAGPNVVTFDHAGLKIGLLICFDVEFPECTRSLALAGAELILVPTALPAQPGSPFIANAMIPVRAYENQLFVAYCDHADADAAFAYQGLSCIAAPDGTLLSQAPETGETLIFAEITPADYAEAKVINPYVAEWRASQRPD
ncbi:carbon-nitrogen hydrolase family protein [Roseovarius sp. C7]|uniref:carbon-nitrogen hydrolase family protein n=1 Tax=Roseovarius sp. C7 TaxID=3398643 RepID=UPI0039F65B66